MTNPQPTDNKDNSASRPPRSETQAAHKLMQGSDSESATFLYERHAQRLRNVAKRKLTEKGVRPALQDPDAAATDAFLRVLQGLNSGEFQVKNREKLRALLNRTLEFTCSDDAKILRAKKRRDEGASVLGLDTDGSPAALKNAEDPCAANLAEAFGEETEALLEELPTRLSELARLKLQGYTNRECADRLNIALRKVERWLKEIREDYGSG